MWVSLFTVVLAVALCLGVGAVMFEQDQKYSRRLARKRVVRVRG